MTRDDYDVVKSENLEPDLGLDENPNHTLLVRDASGKEGWVAGPHGASSCCLSDWLQYVGEPAATRDEAIRIGTSDHIAESGGNSSI
jgi:hypothetical protein